jgi:hypothetical protein
MIKKVKRVDNTMSRAVDHWFDSTIGGYITEFSIDRVESYSQEERYLFKGPIGKFLHLMFRNLDIDNEIEVGHTHSGRTFREVPMVNLFEQNHEPTQEEGFYSGEEEELLNEEHSESTKVRRREY